MSQFDISWLTADWLIQEEYDLEWIAEEYPIFYFQSTTPEEISKIAERVRTIQVVKPELWDNKIAEDWIKTALLNCNFQAAQALRDELLPNELKYRWWFQPYWEMIHEHLDLDWSPDWLAEVLVQARPHFTEPYFSTLIASPEIITCKWKALEGVDYFDYADTLFLMGESFSTFAYRTMSAKIRADFNLPNDKQIKRFAEGFIRWAEKQSNVRAVRAEFFGIKPFCDDTILHIVPQRLAEFWGSSPEYSSGRLPKALCVTLVLAEALELPEAHWRTVAEELYRRASDLGGDVIEKCNRVAQKYRYLPPHT